MDVPDLEGFGLCTIAKQEGQEKDDCNLMAVESRDVEVEVDGAPQQG
jgi:hypothetical protein